jgi:hypothetical protein
MLDLETMSTSSKAAIVAIGAVKFDIKEGVYDRFYQIVDLNSCMELGLEVGGSTIMWWLNQDNIARYELQNNPRHLKLVLSDFSNWIGNNKPSVWGNGSDFDNIILTNAYKACDLKLPWYYSHNRCYRTIKNIFSKIPYEFKGTKHKAIDDAENQALHLIEIFKNINF